MEELIQRISSGNADILFLVGLSMSDPWMDIVDQIKKIQSCCDRLRVIAFKNYCKDDEGKHANFSERDESKSNVMDMTNILNDRFHTIDYNQSSQCPILLKWLQQSKIIYLIDMYFTVLSSSGELSTITKTILQCLSSTESEHQIYCLHSVSVLYRNQKSTNSNMKKAKRKINLSPLFSEHSDDNHHNGMTNLTSGFHDVSIIHMVLVSL